MFALPSGDAEKINIGNPKEIENGRLRTAKHTHKETVEEKPETSGITETGTATKTKKSPDNNSADSMYTESDLEEAGSHVLDGPNTKEIDPENLDENIESNDDNQLLDIYTESDLEETDSKNNEKHEIEKRSVNSYLFEPAKRDADGFDGSGEGSGDLPTF